MILYASKIFVKQYGILHQTVNSNRWKENNETIDKDDDGYYYEDDYYSGCGGGFGGGGGGGGGGDGDVGDDDVALIESCLTQEVNLIINKIWHNVIN